MLRCYILIISLLSGQFLVVYIYGWHIQTLDLFLKISNYLVQMCNVYIPGPCCVPTTEAIASANFKRQVVHPRRDSLTLEYETDRLFRNVGN